MAETLRELVVALSLDSSNFSRNMRTINATREALDRMTAGCYLLCLPQEISGNLCWSPEDFLSIFCFLFHCPLDGKRFNEPCGSLCQLLYNFPNAYCFIRMLATLAILGHQG